MKVNEYIADFLVKKGIKHVYGLMGGGASGLNDGFIKNPDIHYVSFHHEQSAGYAAIGETRITGIPSIVNPTTGCGGTNCMTPLLNAWQDSLPVIFISGNVKLEDTTREINYNKNITLRKYGVQEHDIISTVKSITKMATMPLNADEIPYIMHEAFIKATTGRPGPVWIDIPSNIQVAEIPQNSLDIAKFLKFEIEKKYTDSIVLTSEKLYKLKEILEKMNTCDRPLILAGQGIKQAREENRFVEFIKRTNIPYVYTYGASDIMSFSDPLVIGAIGIKGSRAGNFALQSCDNLLVLGCSLNSSHLGYNKEDFARESDQIFHIDIDINEILKMQKNKKYFPLNLNLNDFFNIVESIYE